MEFVNYLKKKISFYYSNFRLKNIIFYCDKNYIGIGQNFNNINIKNIIFEYNKYGVFEEYKVRNINGLRCVLIDLNIKENPAFYIILILSPQSHSEENSIQDAIIKNIDLKKDLLEKFSIEKMLGEIYLLQENFDTVIKDFLENRLVFFNKTISVPEELQYLFAKHFYVKIDNINKIKRLLSIPNIHPNNYHKYFKLPNDDYLYIDYKVFMDGKINEVDFKKDGYVIKYLHWDQDVLHPNYALLFKVVDALPFPCNLIDRNGTSYYKNTLWDCDFEEAYSKNQNKNACHILNYKQLEFIDVLFNQKGFTNDVKLIIGFDKTKECREKSEYVALLKKLEISNMELNRFAHICSHDLKEPLRSISNFVQLIKKNPNESNEFISHIEDNIFYMKTLIDNLLKYAESGYSHELFDYWNARDLLALAFNALSLKIKDKKAIIKVLTDLPNKIFVRKTQMIQLFQNIIDNALKFNRSETPIILISYANINKCHRFVFKDNGIGIDNEFLNEVFGMFKRLHPKDKKEGSGSGIGLAMCEKIVENHNGKIWLESDPGKSTSVYIEIPDHSKEEIKCAV